MLDYTVMVVDSGIFQPLAHRLAKGFKRVKYYREYHQGFPLPNDMAVGENYPDLECVDSIMGEIHDTDLFVFPDIMFSEDQEYLRSIGKLVFGSGDADSLEMFRDDFYATLKSVGLPNIPQVKVKGVAKLRDHLKENEDKWIKVSYVRGLCETWHHENYVLSKPFIDEIEFKLNAISEEQEFIVQDALDAEKEIGSDQIIVDGNFPKTVQWAIEGKDKTCLATMKPYAMLPQGLKEIYMKMQPKLKPVRGFFSSEVRKGKKDGKFYFTDPTMRCASPCGETYMAMCDNLPEMVLGAAQGQIVEPQYKNRFAAQAMISSDLAETLSVPIQIDPKVREFVHLYHSGIRESDGEEVVYQTDARLSELGSVLGLSSVSIDDAIKKCCDNAKGIHCQKISICTDSLPEFKKDLLT